MKKLLLVLTGAIVSGIGWGVGKAVGEEIGQPLVEFGKSLIFGDDG